LIGPLRTGECGRRITHEGFVEMALIGKTALVANVRNIISGTQPRFGVLHA
jgi:hypothetical protein